MKYSEYFRTKYHHLTKTDENFIKWIDIIENIVMNNINMQLLDIPDEPYMNYFEQAYSPEQVVKIIFDDFPIII